MVSNRSAYSPGSKVPLRWAERQAFNAVAAAAGAGGGRAEQPVAQHEAQRLGLDFYERELTGRIMTRMTTDVDSLSSFFQIRLITMVNSVLTFAVVLIFMLITNLRLGLLLGLDRASAHRRDLHFALAGVASVPGGPRPNWRGQHRPLGERRLQPLADLPAEASLRRTLQGWFPPADPEHQQRRTGEADRVDGNRDWGGQRLDQVAGQTRPGSIGHGPDRFQLGIALHEPPTGIASRLGAGR